MDNPGKVLGIVSLILGILGANPFGGQLFAIVGIILGILSKKKSAEAGAPSGLAMAGIICGAVGLLVGTILLVACSATFCACVEGGGCAEWLEEIAEMSLSLI